ncbi:MAG: thioesterase family protein [Mycobacteriaceae bacterium]
MTLDGAPDDTGGSPGRYSAVLTEAWTIGPKAHGGVLLALCAKAARTELGRESPEREGPGIRGMEPVAVSAGYLHAPDPGPVDLAVTVVKRGRTVSVVDVELGQSGRPAVRASVTLGFLDAGAPRHAAANRDQPVEPPADAVDVAGHPSGTLMNLAGVCDLRVEKATAPYLDGRTDPEAEVRLWVRPHAEEPDVLFALMAGDVGPPVTLNHGLAGWAPTVQLTALLRARPAPGWLRVQMSSHTVGRVWFDEDAVVLDSTGSLVCQTRQLALAPGR